MRYYKRFKLIISVAMLLFTIGCVRQENKSDESYDLLSSDMWKTDGFAVMIKSLMSRNCGLTDMKDLSMRLCSIMKKMRRFISSLS